MFFCECLNIIGEINSNVHKKLESSKVKINPIQSLSDTSYFELLDFFKLALGPINGSDAKISIQHAAFVNHTKIDDKWIVSKCLNCDGNVYGTTNDGTNQVLINGKMLRDESLLSEMMKNENYSMPFKIILKPMELLPNSMKSTINDDLRVKHLYSRLQEYIEHQEKEAEAEIRRITLAMNERRQRAEKEFQLITTLMNSIESSGASSNNRSTLESTKMMSIENIQSFSITPPVTPENAQMTIDHAPFTKLVSSSHNHREGISKHNSALIQKQITRTIDFEDDIFELDGMQQQEPNRDDDGYHKYSDTELSDNEEVALEKRPYMRGRSGSLAIARSAPISMPQFLHHTNPHLEEKHINEQDIAGSIKLLAKSIHADSIFGDLPNRNHVFKYNAEF